MHQFSIVTPTFNRAKYLPRFYESLCQQDDMDFEWVVVDDGSSDNTKEVIASFNSTFKIKYIYQENAGFSSAWNTGVESAEGYIVYQIDDEDLVLPHALKKVWSYFDVNTGRFENNCICVVGLCKYDTGEIVGGKFPYDYYISDEIRYRRNKNVKGDKSLFFVTEICKKYPFPIINGEKVISPQLMYQRMALDGYKTLYLNEFFETKHFQEGGLSSQSVVYKYPLSSELYYNESSLPPFRFGLQLHHSSRYIYFAKINKKKHIFRNALNKKIYFLGLCRYYMILLKDFLVKFRFFAFLLEPFLKKRRKQRIITSG